jgi:cytochrome b-561
MPNSPKTSAAVSQNPLAALARWRDEFKEIFSARVRESQLGFRRTWYLGALTLGTFAIQVSTGVLLMLYYHPSIPQGYADMKDMQFVVPSGMLLRSLHRWSAHAMVFLVFAHMAKVFYRRAYFAPRQLNWVVGVGLLGLTVLLSYTGYLLPWDQLSYWGTTVGSNIMSSIPLVGDRLRFTLLGGNTVNANALLRFYVLHTMILPLTAIMLVSIHLWRLHQDGGMYAAGARKPEADSSLAGKEEAETTLSYRELLLREITGIQVLALFLVLIALRWHAPLEQLADPLHTPNPAKAPWYFTGLQEMLHYFPPFIGGIILPAQIALVLIVIPFFPAGVRGENLWGRNKSRRLLAAGTIVAIISAVLIRVHAWDALLPLWVVATFMGLAATGSQSNGFRGRLRSRGLAFWFMTWFLLEGVVLTAVGTFFRGPGWSWVWPWGGN